MEANILLVTVGLPRSGKSTWAMETGYPVVNPDSIRLALHGQRFEELAEPFVWAIAMVMVRALFLAGHKTVVVDATNTTRKRRDLWRGGDRWFEKFVFFSTDVDECTRRAGSDEVIIPVIERMAEQFESFGVDEIHGVPRSSGDRSWASFDGSF